MSSTENMSEEAKLTELKRAFLQKLKETRDKYDAARAVDVTPGIIDVWCNADSDFKLAYACYSHQSLFQLLQDTIKKAQEGVVETTTIEESPLGDVAAVKKITRHYYNPAFNTEANRLLKHLGLELRDFGNGFGHYIDRSDISYDFVSLGGENG